MKKKLIGIFVCMLLIGTTLSVSGNVLMDKPTRTGNHITVSCQMATINGIKQIEKDIPESRFYSIIELANEVQSLIKGDFSLNALHEKLFILTSELKNFGLLPKYINVDIFVDNILKGYEYSHQISTPLNTIYKGSSGEKNFMNLVVGVGQESIAYCLRADFLGMFILAPISFVIKLLIEVGILKNEHFTMFLDIADILQWKRPRALFALGWWDATSGSVGTIGLDGIRYRYSNDSPVGLSLIGFTGIAVTSRDSGLNNGFIIGFSLISQIT